MNSMKLKRIIFALFVAAMFVACERDGDLITMSGLNSSDLTANRSAVVLQKDSAASVGLTLNWSKSALVLSDTSMRVPDNIPSMLLEISTSETFDQFSELAAANYTKSFTFIELNTLAINLGFEPFKASPLYFRIKAQLGNNTQPLYSNVAVVNVTPYTIDMSVGYIMDKDRLETGVSLYSPNSDGEYRGFMGAVSWYNFFMLEGDGTTWGNYAVDGYAFSIDSDANSATIWNFWFPGQNGCFYTTLSTNSKQWTATWISSLTLGGDVEADMTYNRAENYWMAIFSTTKANATFNVNGISALYNATTGTDDAAAVAGTVRFAPGTGSEVLFNQNGTFTVPGAAGDYTLKINLSNPKAWTYEIVSGTVVVVEPISKFMYLPGIDDGRTGASWNFDNYLRLVSEDDSTFAGVANVNSLWGYQMGLTKDDWDNVYKSTSGDAYAGTLGFKEGGNIPAPTPGLYLIKADLKNKTYGLTEVKKVYYTGLNDDWALTEMNATANAGVYTAQVSITKASEWGFQIFVDDKWINKFGGANGVLGYNAANITDDKNLAAGTYTLIVDLVKGTYLITEPQLYVTGLNDVWDFTSAVLPQTATGIFSGSVTISKSTPWGYNFLLYNGNWDAKLGGSETALELGGANVTAAWYLSNGTYTMTVDLIQRKCTVK